MAAGIGIRTAISQYGDCLDIGLGSRDRSMQRCCTIDITKIRIRAHIKQSSDHPCRLSMSCCFSLRRVVEYG